MLRAAEREESVSGSEGGRMGELYAAHAPAAGRLAYLLTGDRQMAEDLVQEAFVRMFGRFRDLRHPEAFRSYLRTAVVNLARSHFRRAKTEREYLKRQKRSDGQAPEPIEERHDLWRQVVALPMRQRAALVLRYYEDLSEAQTAEVLRCAVGTVKSLTSRAIENLRQDLGRE